MKTLKDLAQESLDVQDACNLSGVVLGFSRALSALRELGINDTEALNRHPISVLWADKIAHLTGTQQPGRATPIFDAYDEVQKVAEG